MTVTDGADTIRPGRRDRFYKRHFTTVTPLLLGALGSPLYTLHHQARYGEYHGSVNGSAGVATANVTNDDIRADATNNSQVVTNGMGLQGQRYSTLDMLNTENVSSLQPVWAFSLGGEKQRGQQSQPMIKDGVMPAFTSQRGAYKFSIDKAHWTHKPPPPEVWEMARARAPSAPIWF